MADTGMFGWLIGSAGTGADMPGTMAAYMQTLTTLDQLEVIGLITIGLALTQFTLCLTLALDNYQMSRPMKRR